jgi:hypothetical protein
VSDRFHVGGACSRQFSGPTPIRDCPFRQAGIGQMLGQHFGMSFVNIRESLFQSLGDAGV